MGISLCYGLPGAGKSHFSLYYGLLLAEKYRKRLATNFILNLPNVARYCSLMGYSFLLENLHKDWLFYFSATSHLEDILSIKNSIILLDEAGIFVPARGSSHKTPKQLLADLCQVRHDSQYLVCIAQSERQIDVQIRLLASEIFHCRGTSVFSHQLNNEHLIFKNVLRFDPDRYEQWLADPKLRKNPLKSRMVANKSFSGFLTASDKFLFECFDSFGRLDQVGDLDDYERIIALSKDEPMRFDYSALHPDFPSSTGSNHYQVKPKWLQLLFNQTFINFRWLGY